MKAIQKNNNTQPLFSYMNGWSVAANDDVYHTTLASLSTNDVHGCTSVAGAGCAGATNVQITGSNNATVTVTGTYNPVNTGVNIPADDWNIPYTAPLNSTAGAHAQITIYHNDVLGSPVAFTNEEGVLQARKEFQPYGLSDDVSNDTTNTIGFTGHVEARDFGLVYMQARWLDAKTGRVLSMDVPPFNESNPMSFNRYAYANDNPYRFVDPDGRKVLTADGGEIAIDKNGRYYDKNSVDDWFTKNLVKSLNEIAENMDPSFKELIDKIVLNDFNNVFDNDDDFSSRTDPISGDEWDGQTSTKTFWNPGDATNGTTPNQKLIHEFGHVDEGNEGSHDNDTGETHNRVIDKQCPEGGSCGPRI